MSAVLASATDLRRFLGNHVVVTPAWAGFLSLLFVFLRVRLGASRPCLLPPKTKFFSKFFVTSNI